MFIKVNKHKLEIIKTPVNEKEINITKFYFEFPDTMDNYVKEAYFTLKGKSYKVIIQNNECDIPSEVLEEKGTVEIGVVAFYIDDDNNETRYNPSPAYFDTWVGSLKDDTENSKPITPSEIEQFEQELQKKVEELATISVPNGGTAGQVLTKMSDEDYDTNWTNVSGGGGGTNNYQELLFKPKINDIILEGNKTSEQLKLQDKMTRLTNSEILKIMESD